MSTKLLCTPKTGTTLFLRRIGSLIPVLIILICFCIPAHLQAAEGGNTLHSESNTDPVSVNIPNFDTPALVRSFRITDASTEGGCFPTPGSGVIFQKQSCQENAHYIWRAGADLLLNEYADQTATITGTVIDEIGRIGQVNIALFDYNDQGNTWNKQCYLDGIADLRSFYRGFSGTILVDGAVLSIEVKKSEQHYILADGAGLQPGQFGFGAWTGGSFGECTEWFGTLTPIIDCDLTVDAGEDIEECVTENVELTASQMGNVPCATGCTYTVLDTAKCSGTSEEVYLFVSNGNTAERKFQASSQNFETFDDGTARYTATASNGIDVIEVNMLYSGRTDVAPANSPKTHSCEADQEISDFIYYPTQEGTIVSQNHGTFYATEMGPSFQIGIGADVERSGFGASGWFDLSGGDGYYSRGDVNIPLGVCETQEVDEVSFVWSTTDGNIVGNANQETIEVSTSGTYTVTVTTCNGCEATDEVTVTLSEKLSIGDFVWEDTNNNGLQDEDELGVDGISVTLYGSDESLLNSTETTNGGAYSFEVCPGEYYVVFDNVPVGFGFTEANAANDTLDSDADENGRTVNFIITDTDNPTIDAGLVQLCTIDPAVDGDDEICAGEVSTLVATGGDSYLWSTGETTASIQVAPTATTIYTVVVSDSSTLDCSEEVAFTVVVPSVNIDAGPDVNITFGDSTTLTVTGADASDSIIWSTGETSTSIVVAPEVTTTYSVTVVNALGCIDEDSVTVNVKDECGIKPAFKILPRDQPGVYVPGYETAACIGDDLYLWMYADIANLNDGLAEDYSDWSFTYELPHGAVIVQDNLPIWPGNQRAEKLDLKLEDFGDYKISWVSPTGCTGTTVFTLNFPDEGCGDNGTRISDIFSIDAVYPVPATAGGELTLEVSTKSGSINTLASKTALNTTGKTPELVSRKETVRVSLYNFDGRQVGSTQTFDVEQGKAKVYYQLGTMATGHYIIKVESDLWTDSKQISIK
ncbi:hypothetical protein FGM00_10225 [Aggregatimonas sangjinii]|uniref:PKD domain-containing protein n=1 Tax=Aggregatimonas sangjinii TaxID=2583587 RepID=A0A5B7SUD9_9FLAO|nr:SdrD B-like domain-containing protein [Aggregatimonas sangjinii]QCX00470.1 hypothetical protein FGM00_10225 [Aggregatimonas sangjinii]